MVIVLDQREDVARAQVLCFEREGIAAMTISETEFEGWFSSLVEDEIGATELFVIDIAGSVGRIVRTIRDRTPAAIIAVGDSRKLDDTLRLFALGVDDVVYRPVHVREIMARARAIGCRGALERNNLRIAGITIPSDGSDPVVGGDVLNLPRRERRILDCLARARGGWVSKAQIFNRVYGVLNDLHDESVIESHICRLRKRLRQRLAFDPIESQRYLGYRLIDRTQVAAQDCDLSLTASPTQAASDGIELSELVGAMRRGPQ